MARTCSPGRGVLVARWLERHCRIPATMGRFTRIDHVQLAMPAGREDDARAFYVDVLGFAEQPKPEKLRGRGGVWFASGTVRLHLGIDACFTAATKAHPALRCATYAAIVAEIERAGIAIRADPLPFEGQPHCYIDDPFGNRIELIADDRAD